MKILGGIQRPKDEPFVVSDDIKMHVDYAKGIRPIPHPTWEWMLFDEYNPIPLALYIEAKAKGAIQEYGDGAAFIEATLARKYA